MVISEILLDSFNQEKYIKDGMNECVLKYLHLMEFKWKYAGNKQENTHAEVWFQ